MECEDTAELLPWFLNGTLAADQQQDVRDHLAQCDKCRQEMDETLFAHAVYRQHVPAEALIDHAFGRPVQAVGLELLEQHLQTCRECAEQYRMARESRRLEQDEAAGAIPFVSKEDQAKRVRLWQYGALAASLVAMIAVAGWILSRQQAGPVDAGSGEQRKAAAERLAEIEAENQRLREEDSQLRQQRDDANSQIAQLQQQLGELASPQLNALVVDVYPTSMTERSEGAAANELSIPRSAKSVTLILNSQNASSHRSYSAEIASAENQIVWREQGLLRQPAGDYTISIPAGFLNAGSYTINIYGETPGRRTKVETYRIRVTKSRP
jgi:predicted anti-sigma-YlaC factor YlaD